MGPSGGLMLGGGPTPMGSPQMQSALPQRKVTVNNSSVIRSLLETSMNFRSRKESSQDKDQQVYSQAIDVIMNHGHF